MATFRILDQTGHSTEVFDRANKTSLAAAEARFKELTGKGFAAAETGEDGTHTVTDRFNPDADTIFVPHLKGG